MVVVDGCWVMEIVVSILDVVVLDEFSIDILKWHCDNMMFVMVDDSWLTMGWDTMGVMVNISVMRSDVSGLMVDWSSVDIEMMDISMVRCNVMGIMWNNDMGVMSDSMMWS